MAISKLSKSVMLMSLFLILSIITLAIYTIENPYIDPQETQKCDIDSKSKFVASGRPIYICFTGYGTNETKKTNITLIRNENFKVKDLKFYPLSLNDSIYFTNSKISKLDTVLIEISDKKIKLYDFVYEGEKINAGQYKGHYSCQLFYKENNSIDIFTTGDTIYINKD